MHKAVKIRIYPKKTQQDFLNAQFGAVRFVYNKALAIIKHQYKIHGLSLSPSKHIKPLLSVAKKSRKYSWLNHYDSISLQEACRNLGKAYTNFFKKRARFPKFKKKHFYQSSYHCTAISFGENWIKIPKLKSRIKAKMHRVIDGQLKSIQISKTCTGKYYASLLFDTGLQPMTPKNHLENNDILGIDIGINHLLNLSTGEKITNPRYLDKAMRNVKRKQKSLTRKTKGSKRRRKARVLLAKCHERIANARNDFQHKLTRKLVDENQAIVVETLKVKNMLKNHKLAKSISDCAWGMLSDKLAYKTHENGKYFVKIDQWFASSKTCSCCGDKKDTLSLSIRSWSCPSCHAHHDRDLNAALNIKAQGILRLKAEGKSVSASGGLRKTG